MYSVYLIYLKKRNWAIAENPAIFEDINSTHMATWLRSEIFNKEEIMDNIKGIPI